MAVGLGHRVFEPARPPRTHLEAALGSVLRELNDSAPYVEYWTRQPWKHIEAHADVDEKLAAESGMLRYPQHGHVLYLAVGTRVRGPTCVFDAVRGSDLAASRSANSSAADAETTRALIIVPAVPGRLLRFQGNLLHAVPAPTDRWLTPFSKSTPILPEAEWQRVVVLFNTWESPPPLDVERDPPVADALDSVDGNGAVAATCGRFQSWNAVHIHGEDLADNENMRACASSGGDAEVMAKVWLLGDENRRGQAGRTVQVMAPATLGQALAQERKATRLALRTIS